MDSRASNVVKEDSVTFNAKELYEIVREVPNEQVQLKRLEPSVPG